MGILKRLLSSLVILLVACYCCPISAQVAPQDVASQDDYSYGNRMMRRMMGGLMTAGQAIMDRMASGSVPGGPGIYDMSKNDTSLGINVLSGLVKVDRVREPGKPRALSVRVFGIPVYNRGFNRGESRPSDSGSNSEPEIDFNRGGAGSAGRGSSGEEEELPLDP